LEQPEEEKKVELEVLPFSTLKKQDLTLGESRESFCPSKEILKTESPLATTNEFDRLPPMKVPLHFELPQ
jgi:hypothetical protein